jgi:hypothetical protein
MPPSSLRIIVTGLIAQYPMGGVTWDYLQYVVGLSRLGHDVYYLEDTGLWPYNPGEQGVSKGCEFNVRYLAETMSRFGLADRWMYRFPWESQWFGLADTRREEVIGSADLLINVSGTLEHPERYRGAARFAYVDSDPVFTQLKLVRGQEDFRRLIDMHDVQFSFGELIERGGAPQVPQTGHRWLPTRQPIVLDEWAGAGDPSRDAFTTIMNWTSYKPVEFDGRQYGQKDLEFARFVDLPSLVDARLEVAVGAGKMRQPPRQLLARRGWHVVDPGEVCPDLETYRTYIQSSKAEWSVAKHGYVAGRPGWFSCRSACYLAAGRPVVVQDTGFSNVLPTGEGLLAFETPSQAAEAINRVVSDYERHARAAREIARAYFDAGSVLAELVDIAMAPVQATAEIAT